MVIGFGIDWRGSVLAPPVWRLSASIADSLLAAIRFTQEQSQDRQGDPKPDGRESKDEQKIEQFLDGPIRGWIIDEVAEAGTAHALKPSQRKMRRRDRQDSRHEPHGPLEQFA